MAATVTMKGGTTPARVELEYRVAAEWAQRYAVEHGEHPSLVFSTRFDLKDLAPQLRERALRIAPAAARVVANERNPFLRLPTLPQPTSEPAVVVAAWEEFLADVHPETSKKGLSGLALETLKKRQFLEGMHEWAAEHGSDRLRMALQRGYHASGIYVRERAGAALPTFVADVEHDVSYREAINPSAAALELEAKTITKLEADGALSPVRIVWVVNRSPETWRGPLQGEAVFVDFLERLRLFYPLEIDRTEP